MSQKYLILSVVFLFIGCILYSQGNEVTGTVKDGSGVPLPGVNITVVNSDRGTQTDFDGNFTIYAEEGDILNFSYIGFEDQKVTVHEGQAMDIVMQEGSSLDEVVVVGYGAQSKRDLTGSVSSVKTQELSDIPSPSIGDKLAGKVAGVDIANYSGSPGGAAKIKIRGTSSIGSSSDPLVVIDGFPMTASFDRGTSALNLLNPDDIESISVLKDASSTAIYGSRGANGVIMIETKKGKVGKSELNLNIKMGLQQVPQKGRPNLLNAREFAQFQKELREDKIVAQGKDPSEADIPEMYQNPEQYGEGTNWYKTIIQLAPQKDLNLSFSGGNEKSRSFFSLNYFDQDGVIKFTGFKRYSLRSNIEMTPLKHLKVGLNVAPSFSKFRMANVENTSVGVVGTTRWLNPIIPVYNDEGKRNEYITGPGLFGSPNPLDMLEFDGSTSQSFDGIGNFFAEYQIFEGFKARMSYAIRYTNSKSSSFHPSFMGRREEPAPTVAQATRNNSIGINQDSEIVLTYDKNLRDIHTFNFMAGLTAQKDEFESTSIAVSHFGNDNIKTIGAANQADSYDENIEKWSLLSYFGRLNYNFKHKYYLTGTIRRDGSSRFGERNRYGTFPSIGVAWQVDEETFLKNLFFETLKIRASWGISGNFNIGNYTFIPRMQTSNYIFNDGQASGLALSNLGNPSLTWEESREWNFGMEMGFFDDRINFSADFYVRNTNNMLMDRRLPLSSGFESSTVNAGEIRNMGLELSLNTDNFVGEFNWSSSINFSINRNEILSLQGDRTQIISGGTGEGSPTHISKIGRPIGEFYGYVSDGFYNNSDDLNNSPTYPSAVVGSIKYKDINGDGKIDPVSDFDIIGNPYPDFTFGVTNHFDYKNFDLNVVIDGQYGAERLYGTQTYLHNIDGIFNVSKDVINRWRSPEDPGAGIVPTTNGGRVEFRDINPDWVKDASYLRLRNISLGYSFSDGLFGSNSPINRMRISASVQNLFTITSYPGGNPHSQTEDSPLTPGRDDTTYPLPRTYVFGFNVSF